MSQKNIQNYENSNQNSIPSDRMTNYLQNQRPSVIMGNNNEPIIIPPLNTDIRFNAYNSNSDPSPSSQGRTERGAWDRRAEQQLQFKNHNRDKKK